VISKTNISMCWPIQWQKIHTSSHLLSTLHNMMVYFDGGW
jgi:hypothetical protein